MARRYGTEPLAWAAGLLDGVGSLYLKRRSEKTGKRPAMALTFQGVDRATLERFAAVVGRPGTLCALTRTTSAGSTIWQLGYTGKNAETVVAQLEPWLGARRLKQLAAIRALVASETNMAGRSWAAVIGLEID